MPDQLSLWPEEDGGDKGGPGEYSRHYNYSDTSKDASDAIGPVKFSKQVRQVYDWLLANQRPGGMGNWEIAQATGIRERSVCSIVAHLRKDGWLVDGWRVPGEGPTTVRGRIALKNQRKPNV